MKTIEELKALRTQLDATIGLAVIAAQRATVLAIIDTALAAEHACLLLKEDLRKERGSNAIHSKEFALKAQLDAAIAERDAARAVTAEVQGSFGLAKATARSLAMEEAARKLEATCVGKGGISAAQCGRDAADAVRALAPLPAGLVAVRKEAIDAVWVEAESLQRVANALVTIAERARDDLLHCRDGGSSASAQRAIERMDAAASALPDQNLAEALALLKEGA